MNKNALIKNILFYSVPFVVILTIGYWVITAFGSILVKDEPSVGWFWGVFGTLYALITAFVLSAVWGKFHTFEESLSNEAKNIISIWNYTDYLNDDKVSIEMKKVLLKYLDTTIKLETQKMGINARVVHPSKELVAIMKVIDGIEFNDKRDSTAFASIITAYEDLSTARNNRIENSLNRIPPLLKGFFILVSTLFVLSYLINGFYNPVLYLITTGVLSIVVFMGNIIIFDLDNPIVGIWNVNFDVYKNAAKYIKSTVHEK